MRVQPGHVVPFVALVLALGVGRLVVGFPAEAPAAQSSEAAPFVGLPAQTSEAAQQAAAGADTGERAIEPAPERFDGPLPPGAGAPCRPHPGPPASGGTWALIVGINDYPGSGRDLRSSVNDARDVEAALDRYGVPADHRLTLLDGQASSCGLRAGLDWLVERAGPDSTAVFAYSGHARKSGASRTLITADGALFSDTQLGASLSRLRSARTWVMLAACYAGGFTQVLRPNTILTAASGPDSLAYENLGFGRSYLVEYMVRQAMLEAAAPSSVEAAFAYAASSLSASNPARVPVQFDQLPGELVLGPAPPAKPRPGPVAAAVPAPAPGAGTPRPSPARPPVVTTTTRPCRPVLLILCAYD